MSSTAKQRIGPLRAAWQVLRASPELVLVPFLSLVTSAVYIGVLAGIFRILTAPLGNPRSSVYVLAGFMGIVGIVSITIFFNAAIIATSSMHLRGDQVSLRGGLRAAGRRWAAILRWALYTTTVGALLRMIPRRGLLGSIAGYGAEAAWAAITFFVVPVIVLEDLNVTKAIRRSREMTRRDRYTALRGAITIPLITALPGTAIIVAALLLLLTEIVSMPLALAIGVVGAILAIAGSTVHAIFGATAYDSARIPPQPEGPGWSLPT